MLRTTTRPRSLQTCLCAMLCLGCTSGEEIWSLSDTGFPHAYFHDDCAPWDGPALSIVLSQTQLGSPFELGFPSVRVTSWRPPAELAGASLEWSGVAHDLGYASFCESEDSCRTASTVRLRFDPAQPSADELAGQLHLEFEDGRVVSGAFRAVRLPFRVLCG